MYYGKSGNTEHSKGNKTIPGKVATTPTGDGHRLQKKHYNINQRDDGTQDDLGRDGGTKFILTITEQKTRLTLQEYDNDDDYDDDDKCRDHVADTGNIIGGNSIRMKH